MAMVSQVGLGGGCRCHRQSGRGCVVSKHSRLPWKAAQAFMENSTPTWNVYTPRTALRFNGECVAVCASQEDAEFIAKACNAHNELLAACKSLLHLTEAQVGECFCLDTEGRGLGKCVQCEARAVMAKAEGYDEETGIDDPTELY